MMMYQSCGLPSLIMKTLLSHIFVFVALGDTFSICWIYQVIFFKTAMAKKERKKRKKDMVK